MVKHDVNLCQFVYIILIGFRCLLLRGMGSSRGGKIGEVFGVLRLRCRRIGGLVGGGEALRLFVGEGLPVGQ